jgi:DNA-binding NarL/FixJ family response regulator
VIRVVVADDEPLAREGLAALIGSAPDIEVIATATDGAEAVALARRLDPDVVVMDARMPVMDGIAATAALLADNSDASPNGPVPAGCHPRVLVLTTSTSTNTSMTPCWQERAGSCSKTPVRRSSCGLCGW